jgi:NADH-quinone oxidoreductase subunit L
VLAVVVGIVIQWPFQILGVSAHFLNNFLDPVFAGSQVAEPGTSTGAITLAIGTLASLFGAGLAYRLWFEKRPHPQTLVERMPRLLPQLSWHKFYFDELYDATLVRPVRVLASSMRRIVEPRVMDGWIRGLTQLFADVSIDFRSVETGLIRDYATGMLFFAGVFVLFIVVWIAK